MYTGSRHYSILSVCVLTYVYPTNSSVYHIANHFNVECSDDLTVYSLLQTCLNKAAIVLLLCLQALL